MELLSLLGESQIFSSDIVNQTMSETAPATKSQTTFIFLNNEIRICCFSVFYYWEFISLD